MKYLVQFGSMSFQGNPLFDYAPLLTLCRGYSIVSNL
jgi:hypothetical protein